MKSIVVMGGRMGRVVLGRSIIRELGAVDGRFQCFNASSSLSDFTL